MDRYKFWNILLLPLLCLFLAANAAHAKEGDVHTLFENSNLREGPDNFYASVASVSKGDRAIELTSSGMWRKVRLLSSGDVGWLSETALLGSGADSGDSKGIFVSDSESIVNPISQHMTQQSPAAQVMSKSITSADRQDIAMAPAKQTVDGEAVSPMFEDGAVSAIAKSIEPQDGLPKAVEHGLYRFKNKANLRAGPNVKHETVSWARAGAHATFLDRTGNWLRIQMQVSKRIGWVYKDSLISESGAKQAGFVDATQPSRKSLPKVKDKVQTMVSRVTQQSEAKTIVNHATRQAVVDSGGLFGFHETTVLRSGPGMAFDTIAWVNTESKAVKHNQEGDWVQVQMQVSKQRGWVHKHALLVAPLSTSKSAPKQVLVQAKENVPTDPLEQGVETRLTQMNTSPKAELKSSIVPVATRKVLPTAVLPSAIRDSSAVGAANGTDHVLLQTTMIRKEPSALSEVLGWAGGGAQVEKLSQQGKWTKVRMQNSGRVGWVEAVSFQVAGVAGMPPVKPAKATQPVDSLAAEVNVASSSAKSQAEVQKPAAASRVEKSIYKFNKKSNMRAGPNVIFETISWAGEGSKALAIDRVGDWVRIQMLVSKRMGWVFHKSLDMVSADVGAAGLSLAAAGGATTTVSTFTPQGGANSNKKTEQQAVPEKMRAQDQTHEETVVASDLYSFNKKSNLRAGPGQKHEAISWAGNGAYAKELDRKGDWVRVQMQVSKRIGWVYHQSLKFVKAGVSIAKNNIEADANTAQKASAGSDKQLYFFKRTSNLRAGPGKKYERIAWGGRNESAEEIAHQGDWKRVRMTISGKVGWVFNSYLIRAIHTGYSDINPVQETAADIAQIGRMYQVIRTEPLRADAGDFSELIGSVQKGDTVAWLEERDGWVRINPQVTGSKVGWIEAKLLKQSVVPKFEHKQALINKKNAVTYRDRISKGQVFNFSYAALEEALYKVPVEDIHIRIGKDDLKALFLKRQYDQSPFDIRLKTGRYNLHGTVKVLGSSTRIFKKKSLLIKLDKQSGRWYGHRRMALRSMASDKALMREWMAWKMMAAMGMKVPEIHFTRVTFNRGEKTGLYLSIEWMGPEFLEANGLDSRGEFYQPDDAAHCGDLYSTDQLDVCFSKITPQNDDYSNLKAMAVAMNAARDDNIDEVLEQYFDVESVINWMAVNTLVTNGDTYNKNYWLYFHPSKRKWTVIPWDYNLTYGRTYDQYSVKAFRIFNDNFQYYYPPDVGAGNPIKDKVLRNPKLRARLEAKIKHLTGMEPEGAEHTFGWFSPTVMHARIGNLAAVVGKEVYKDTFLSYGEGDFTKSYESLMHYVTSHDYFLKIKLFGDFEWKPEPPNQPFIPMRLPDQLFGSGQINAGGETLHMVDRGWGYFVADVNLAKPLKTKAQFEVRVEGGVTPKYLPTGQSPRRCIERSWVLSTKTNHVSATADLMFEYTQENSRRSEVSPTIHEELLELWMLDGNRWKPIQTEVNEYSNTLIAKNIHLKSKHEYRFVACSPF